MDKPLCVAFDCDGVLADSISSWKTIHDHYGTDSGELLSQFMAGELSDSEFMAADIALWKEKYQLTTDMNSIIDQAKFIADVEQYWTNVRDCVNFENNDISKELSIVSEDTKARLSQAINNIDTGKPDTLVVASQNFSMVN